MCVYTHIHSMLDIYIYIACITYLYICTWTGRPGVLRFLGPQRVGHDWATDLIWSDICVHALYFRIIYNSYVYMYVFVQIYVHFEQLHFHFSLSCIGEGNGNPLQCSCLENPRDGGAWWAAVYGVAQSQTRLKWLSSSSTYILYICTHIMFLRGKRSLLSLVNDIVYILGF